MTGKSTPPTPLIRVTVFNTRKAGLTNAQFVEHWLTRHGEIAAPWLVRTGFLECRQVPITPEDHGLATSFSLSTGPVYDGFVSFFIPNMEILSGAFSDPEYMSTVRPDEYLFLDHSGTKIVFGYDYVRVVDGKQI